MLSQVQKELESTQRENIFHSRCLINNKVCSLIIDGRSSANVASTRVVEKHSLETIPHAKPYKLTWISKEEEIDVNIQVLINFSIGNYMDEVLCDDVPMEAIHLLLGKPWQFDKHTLHDGHTNKFYFHFHGKKITLAPLSPQEKIKKIPQKYYLPIKVPKQVGHSPSHSPFSLQIKKER